MKISYVQNTILQNRKIKRNLSILESSLAKISLVIFCTFVILYSFIFNCFWKEEIADRKLELTTAAIDFQQKANSEIEKLYHSSDFNHLSSVEKEQKIDIIVNTIIYDLSQKYPFFNIGYIDFDTNLKITNDISNDPNFPFVKPSESNVSEYNYIDSSGNQCIANILPVYHNQYIWTKLSSNYIFYNAQKKSALLLGSSILLLLSLLFLINRLINQIKQQLVIFSNNITSDENEKNNLVMNKIPELAPVFKQIQSFTYNLKDLNDELLTIMNGISDYFFSVDTNLNFKFINNTIKENFDQSLIGENLQTSLLNKQFIDLAAKLQESVQSNQPLYWETLSLDNRDYEFNAYPFAQGISVFFRDITDVKQREKEFIRLERLNLIGQMAAGISHEVRNPLTTVKGFLQIFLTKPSCQDLKEDIDLMISEIERANSIISDFLSLAKGSSKDFISTNINQIIERIYPLLRADAFNSNKDVILNLDAVPDILINESEIKQVLLNFIRNGLEASPSGGKVIISSYLKDDKILLEIRDQGQGLPQAVQENFGTPFLTTKDNGTGLGLAISIGIINRHNATIEFETGPNGTTFYISFPLPN